MKIVYISKFPSSDNKSKVVGLSFYTNNLVKNIKFETNDEVYILCDKLNNQTEKYVFNKKNIIRCFDNNLKFVFQLYFEINKIKPDIVHIQHELGLFGKIYTAYLLQLFMLFIKRYKIITTIHGVVSMKSINKNFIKENNFDLPVWFAKAAFKCLFIPIGILSDKVIVHEKYLKEILHKEYLVDINKIEVINLGLDKYTRVDKFEARKKLKIQNDTKVVLFLGYVTGYKGIDTLIDAFSDFSQDKNALLLICGGKHPRYINDKKYLHYYNSKIGRAQKKINPKKLRWVGYLQENEIPLYIGASDLMVYPYTAFISSSGPMSLSASYNLPFIASKVFESIFDDKSILFDSNSENLSTKLNDFFSNKINGTFLKKYKIGRDWKTSGFKTYSLYKDIYRN